MITATDVNRVAEELLECHKSSSLAILARHSIPPQDAEDLIQDTLLILIQKYGEIENPEAWFRGTLRNRCLRYWRTRRARLYDCVDRTLLEALAGESDPRQISVELRADLSRLFNQISNTCQAAIQSVYFEGLTYHETAERMGYRASGIYKVIHRCLASLLCVLTGEAPTTRTTTGNGLSTHH